MSLNLNLRQFISKHFDKTISTKNVLMNPKSILTSELKDIEIKLLNEPLDKIIH